MTEGRTEDFKQHFWQACRSIERDNRVGRVMFATNGVMKRSRLSRRAILGMARKEQSSPSAAPHMSSLLWNMFTGSAPYVDMFRGTLKPGFIYNLAHSLGASLLPGARKTESERRVA